MTREEFVSRWRYTVTGMAAHGYHAETNLSPVERIKYQCEVAAHAEKLLQQMYDSVTKNPDPKPEPKPEPKVQTMVRPQNLPNGPATLPLRNGTK